MRWRNTITDIETDVTANISTTHVPLIAELRLKLKIARNKKGKREERKQYIKCQEEDFDKYNEYVPYTFTTEQG